MVFKKQSAKDKRQIKSMHLQRRREQPSGGQEKKDRNMDNTKHSMMINKMMVEMTRKARQENGEEEHINDDTPQDDADDQKSKI